MNNTQLKSLKVINTHVLTGTKLHNMRHSIITKYSTHVTKWNGKLEEQTDKTFLYVNAPSESFSSKKNHCKWMCGWLGNENEIKV